MPAAGLLPDGRPSVLPAPKPLPPRLDPPTPQGTWPTGIQAPLMDHGDFECLDYVYVWAAPSYDVK